MTAFTKNHSDHSNDTGFQFEFFCDKCGSGWRSDFKTNTASIATGFLRAASSLFGGALGSAASAGDHVKDMLRGRAWDEAFAEANAQGKGRFKQCTRCGIWVCPDVCWNESRTLCRNCAPDLQGEAAAVQAQIAREQLWDKARASDQTDGIDLAKKKHAAACPHCNAPVEGGKFCPECGQPISSKAECAKCGAELPAKAKFCPECGAGR
jgi:hypothetical protein